jgi:hypothetical protein
MLPPLLPDPAAVLEDAEREVPLTEVVALEEMLLVVLVFESTVALVLALEDGDSAEVEATLEAADVVLTFAEANAEVDDAGDETPAVEDGVSSALPGDGVAPAPAPDDEPAVFDAIAEEELLVKED